MTPLNVISEGDEVSKKKKKRMKVINDVCTKALLILKEKAQNHFSDFLKRDVFKNQCTGIRLVS